MALASCAMEAEGPVTLFDPCEPTVIVAAEGTTASEEASIDAALALWAEVGFTRLTRTPIPGAPELVIYFEEAAPVFFGLYEPTRGSLAVNRRLDNQAAWTITIAHELGHAFGMEHVSRSVRTSVMNQGNLTIEPTLGDAEDMMVRWAHCTSIQPPAP